MDEEKRPMDKREAGRLGGQVTLARYGMAHYRRMAAKGGQRVRELIAKGKAAAEEEAPHEPA